MKGPSDKTMEIIETDEKNGRITLTITAPWEQVSSDYNDIVEEHSEVRVPGFRRGKVPRHVVEKRFQREIIDEFSRRCGRRLGREALRQADEEPMGPIEITDIECRKGKPFQFIARFSPMPEIALPDLSSFPIRDDGSDPRDMISHRLLEQVSFEVPDEMVRAELGSVVIGDIDRQGMEWKAAADRVKLLLILKRIARQKGIEVDEADVERRIAEKAVEFGAHPDTLKAEFEKGNGRQRLKDMLLAESTLNFLIEKSGS